MTTAEAGSQSIYSFIERTAESVPQGVRWKTIDYENEPEYHYNVFNGSGGISFFLAEYYRRTDCAKAIDLAIKGSQWSWADNEGWGHTRGIHFGKTGIALAWLHLSQTLDQPDYLNYCAENAEIIMRENPGPFTDLLGGAASNGLYLIRLWQHTNEARYLKGSIRCADWLVSQLVRDDRGCHCLCRPDGQFGPIPFTGVAHGISGVAYYFLHLYEATGEQSWADIAEEILETLRTHAIQDKSGLNWSVLLGEDQLDRCQWSHGSPGIGPVFLKFHELFGRPDYYDIALQCGKTTYEYGDFRNNITQCIGLAGSGEFFLELYRFNSEQRWLDYAQEFAELACGYRVETPEGDAWPTDEPGLYSPDFMYGAAGLGHYFLRLQYPGEISMPLM